MYKILLICGSNMAKSIVQKLIEEKYYITAINNSYEVCESLAKIDVIKVIYGDGTNSYILNDACADEMNIAIALTSLDKIILLFANYVKSLM